MQIYIPYRFIFDVLVNNFLDVLNSLQINEFNKLKNYIYLSFTFQIYMASLGFDTLQCTMKLEDVYQQSLIVENLP